MSLGKVATGRRGARVATRRTLPLQGIVLLVCASLAVLWMSGVALAQEFRFDRVQVEGNKRIQTGTIVSYAAIPRGQAIGADVIGGAYDRIEASGLFERIELDPQGRTLVIRVVEFPTINRISFEGNRRLKDADLGGFIESAPRRVFNPAQVERDADIIAEAYSQQGRLASTVNPRIIRRSDNRVDLIFEISEGDTVEVERVSFVGNRVFSDRRLRRVMGTKQATILRSVIRADTLVADRIEFDKQLLTDFYQSRGYVDFRVNSGNAQLAEERDGVFLVFNVQEGQQFRFGEITVVSDIPEADEELFFNALKVRSSVVYSPSLVENSISRLETLAIRESIDFLRVEPRITRNDRDLTLDVEFALVRGPRIFVERIDIEGNTTTLDRVVRGQFRIVEGDPFNPREIRESAERIRALGYFADAAVDAREGSSPDRIIVDVDVEEQPTGSLNIGGSYSVNNGFGVALGLQESNFIGRGQTVGLRISTAEDARQYSFNFTEPMLLGRNVAFDLDIGYSEGESSFYTYDNEAVFFRPSLSFPLAESSRLKVGYFYESNEMLARDPVEHGTVIGNEIALGDRASSGLSYTFTYDNRLTGLNPNTGFLLQFGQELSGAGGDSKYLKSTAKAIAQTRVFNEEVTLRATVEAGALHWRNGTSRTTDRFLLSPSIMRGFEPGGIGPRDLSGSESDPLGGNFYAVARFEAEFPLGLPEEVGLRGGLFYDVGNLWDLDNANLAGGNVVGAGGSARHVIGFSLLWDTTIGPLRFNFSHALKKEDFDEEQSFDFTISTKF